MAQNLQEQLENQAAVRRAAVFLFVSAEAAEMGSRLPWIFCGCQPGRGRVPETKKGDAPRERRGRHIGVGACASRAKAPCGLV
jgi:hypothetical protein